MPRLLAVLLLFLFSAATFADGGGKHFLWRVSKGTQVIYIAGSIHVLRPSDYPLPEVLESTFKSSAGLVEEIDLSHYDPESAQLQMMQIGSYPPGHSLKTDLPPTVYQRVVELAKKQKADLEMLEPMKPWLASIVMLDNQLVAEGFDPTSGVDLHFADEAEDAHKPVLGLEKASFQLNLLAQLPEKDQEAMLLQSLDQADSAQSDMDGMMAAWRRGDTASLQKELKEEFGPYPEVYQAILVQRNRNWVPQLEKLAASGRQYFVVVGALHLVGPDGVLASLEKDGYKIEQL
ncbi:MAG TPA: TraB/GumN family protein [Gammaproteobacteria bacterium]|nr:TraB/GumN family protein [Gammaproteobacteria bacterium]